MSTEVLRFLRRVTREVDITWRAIKSDYDSTLVPITIAVLVAVSARPGATAGDFVVYLGLALLYALPYIAQFCYSGQLDSVAEDRIEKPFRPLPAGLVTRAGAWRRYLLWAGVFVLASVALGVAKWALCWLLATVFHNRLGGHRHWFTKNCVTMSLGTLAQLGAAWELVHGSMTPGAWLWAVGISLWVGVTVHLQDFRDIEGDRRVRRRTLPIVLGAAKARGVVAAAVVLMGLVSLVSLLYLAHSAAARLCTAVIVGWHAWLVVRLLLLRSRESDHRTYKSLCYLYCVILASGVFFA